MGVAEDSLLVGFFALQAYISTVTKEPEDTVLELAASDSIVSRSVKDRERPHAAHAHSLGKMAPASADSSPSQCFAASCHYPFRAVPMGPLMCREV